MMKCWCVSADISQWTSETYPVNAEEWTGLAEDTDDLFDLTVGHSLTDAAKHHQRPGLQRWVVLECKPGVGHKHANKR